MSPAVHSIYTGNLAAFFKKLDDKSNKSLGEHDQSQTLLKPPFEGKRH